MSDDYDGWALLLVTALSQPIPLQTPEPPTAKACTPRRAFYDERTPCVLHARSHHVPAPAPSARAGLEPHTRGCEP